MKQNLYPHLFAPIQIRNTVFKNRLFSAPNSLRYKTGDGHITENEMAYLEEKARGGAAQLTVGETPVNMNYSNQHPSSVFHLEDLGCLAGLSELALAIKAHGAVPSIQLSHIGSAAQPANSGGNPPMGPSAFVRQRDGVQVVEMDEDMIQGAINDFANAAETVKKAGFEMCQINAGHGWLIYQFLSPLDNFRKDRWGGSLENRVRFLCSVVDAIHDRCGRNFLVEVRISADDRCQGGLKIEDTIEILRHLEGKADLINVSASHHNKPEVWEWGPTPHVLHEHGINVPFAKAIKEAGITIPIIAVGSISTPEMAEEIIAKGWADFVDMARALIADPQLPNKARRGQQEEIIPCIRCMNCLGSMSYNECLVCSVNPAIGRGMRTLHSRKAAVSRKVAVIGGGPAGMQAAITAAQNGHQVTVYEKSQSLGGMLKVLKREHLKEDYGRFLRYLRHMTEKLCHVQCGTTATPELIEQEGYDAVILAIGGSAIIPPVPGLKEYSIPVNDAILSGLPKPNGHVTIIGGGVAGCEAAFGWAEQGYQVTIVEMLEKLGLDDVNVNHNRVYSMPLMFRILKHPNISIRTGYTCKAVTPEAIDIQNMSTDTLETISCDMVVCAAGVRANSVEALTFQDSAPEFMMVGDCRRVARIPEAVHAAYFAALDLNDF